MMQAVYQGASAALVLAGLAVAMAAVALLWWVVGRVRVQNEELALERAASERSAARFQAQLEAQRRRMDLVRAIVPIAAGVAGHLLGSLSARREAAPSWLPPRGGCRDFPWIPPDPVPVEHVDDDDDDDELTHVELDLESLLEAAREVGFGDWLAGIFRRTRVRPTAAASTDLDADASPSA